MALPPYIDRSGEQVYLPPFVATGVSLFGFAVPADLASVQKNVCDRYLNAPLGGGSRFCAVTRHIVFVFNTIATLQAEASPYHDRGRFPEQEAAVWVLVADRQRERLFWFHPYMLVDNSYAMAMGRELYGFPKTLGWFDIPAGPAAPTRLGVETLVVKTFGSDARGERAPLFAVRRSGADDPSRARSGLATIGDLFGDAVRLLGIEGSVIRELGLAANVFDDLVHGRLPMVFLKQIRDGADPVRARAMSIQEADSRLTTFHDARIYAEGYVVDIDDAASHPIRADFGLGPGPQPVDLAFWTSFDFWIGAALEVWSAPA